MRAGHALLPGAKRTLRLTLMGASVLGSLVMSAHPAAAATACEDPFGLGWCDGSAFRNPINLFTGGPGDPTSEPTLNAFITNLLGGNTVAVSIASLAAGPDLAGAIVPLNVDPCDGTLADCSTVATGPGQVDAPNPIFNAVPPTTNARLSQQQKGLLGCGEPFGINCETVGIGLADSETSAFFQSWVELSILGADFDTTDAAVPQPGTVSAPSPACVARPGCRGPGDVGYDPLQDGTASGLPHPFTGQNFRSELAALSWNAMMVFAVASLEFDASDPFRTDSCSLARPQLCSAVCALLALRAQTVEIHILPGDDRTSVNPTNRGIIPVAILGSDVFDVADVDATTLAFGPAGAPLAHRHGPHAKDANHDGTPDLLAHFPTRESGMAAGNQEACVTGELLDGTPFEGCGAIRTVPPQ